MPYSRSYLRRNPQYHEQKKVNAPFFAAAGKQPVQAKKDSFFEAKLSVNQPGDAYEKESDSVADKVVHSQPGAAPAVPSNNISSIQRLATSHEDEKLSTNDARMEKDKEIPEKPIQRMCAECAKEEKDKKVQRKEADGGAAASPHIASRIEQSAGRGESMPASALAEFGSSLNADFSDVKIHTGSEAAEMNKELHAQAFTHGKDIYFGSGKYDPAGSPGKHLLAHELTHVVQQSGTGSRIQKEPGDKHELTDSVLSGNAILKKCFDKELSIGIGRNDKGEHVSKIQQALTQLGIELPKFGVDGNFKNETAGAVKQFQQQVGMSAKEQDGIVGAKTIGLLDRSVRNNSIEKDTDDPKNDFNFDPTPKDTACEGKPTDAPCPDPNTAIAKVAGEATALIEKVEKEQLPPVKNKAADYPSIFSRLFRKNDPGPMANTVKNVKDNFDAIKKYIGRLTTEKDLVRCATECDGGCRSGSPAYHNKDKKTKKDIINICPGIDKDPEAVYILIHESHHAAIPGSSDKAYGDTRLIDKLNFDKALTNAASFHLYASWVDKPGFEPIGPAVKDSNLINDPAQKETVDNALAFIEQWFRLNTFDISATITGAEDANHTGAYSPKQKNAEIFMEDVFSKWFGLTRPPARPTKIDIDKLKGIEKRLKEMSKAFSSTFVILETPNASFWSAGPGADIALNQESLKQDIHHIIIVLLQELVHATPDISAENEPLYVGAINDLRNERNLDPQ